eukprot:2482722-Amphidinium_carterae.1
MSRVVATIEFRMWRRFLMQSMWSCITQYFDGSKELPQANRQPSIKLWSNMNAFRYPINAQAFLDPFVG